VLKTPNQLSSSLALVESQERPEKPGEPPKKWHIIGVDLLSLVGAMRFAHEPNRIGACQQRLRQKIQFL